MNTSHFLISGFRFPFAAWLARSLQAAGAQVTALDCNRAALSKLIAPAVPFVRLPCLRAHPGQFLDAVNQLAQKAPATRLIPMFEEGFWLARQHALGRLDPSIALFALPDALITRLHSKFDVLALAQEAGLIAPRTEIVNNVADWRRLSVDYRAPLLKQEFSSFGHGVFLDPRIPLIEAQLPRRDGGRWLIQERLIGREVCTYNLAHNGKLLAHACYLPRHRWKQSAAFGFEALHHPDVEAFCRRFIAQHSLSGQISFDLMETPDGLAIVECNPRATNGLLLLDNVGARLLNAQDTDAPVLLPAEGDIRSFHCMLRSKARFAGAAQRAETVHEIARSSDLFAGVSAPRLTAAMSLHMLDITQNMLRWRVPARFASVADISWQYREAQ